MLQYWLTWVRTLQREEGQDLAEYALLIALIALGVVGAVTALGGHFNDIFEAVVARLVIPAA